MSEKSNKILDRFNPAGILSLPELLLHELDITLQEETSANAGLPDSDLFLCARLIAQAGAAPDLSARLSGSVSRENLAAVIRQCAAATCFATMSSSRLRFLKQLYLQSVLAHSIARELAARVLPEAAGKEALVIQAGYCGLFLNIGALVLEQVYSGKYLQRLQEVTDTDELLTAETKAFGLGHAELGAALLERWQVDGFCCDAVRYHHAAIDDILDATPLVKIAWLANQLVDEKGSPEAEAWADALFGIQEKALTEIRETAATGLSSISALIRISYTTTRYLPLPESEEDNAHQTGEEQALQALRERVQADSIFMVAGSALAKAETPGAFSTALGLAVRQLHSPCHALLFALDAETAVLQCVAGTRADINISQLAIRAEAERSQIAASCLEETPLFGLSPDGLSVIDRQIRALLGADNFCCEPLRHPTGQVNGVLVLGIPLHQSETFRKQAPGRQALARELGLILSLRQQDDGAQDDLAADYEKRIGETIHEVNNPLGIIKNYLQLLSMKQQDDARMQSEISFIKSEIDRVGAILEKLRDAPDRAADRNRVDINVLVTSLAGMFRGSFAPEQDVRIETILDDSLPEIHCSESTIRQIITNLVKNSAEACADGGTIVIKTAGNVYMNGERFIRISIQDNGPGIAPEILANLFAPGHTTKGAGNRGSGLGIVRNLVENLRGQISCQTNETQNQTEEGAADSGGTEFTVLLPMNRSGENRGENNNAV